MEITDIIPEEPSSGLNTPEKPEETDELEELEDLEVTEASEDAAPEELPRFAAPRRLRPEAIMGIIALVSAVILALTVVLCLPYIRGTDQDPSPAPIQTDPASEEDPELPYREQQNGEEEPLPTIEPIIEPEANPYGRWDFQYNKNNYLYCLRQDSYPGIDVSAFQGDIDWPRVKNSGIRFAMLRLGYRGWGAKGTLVEDEYIQKNLAGCAEAGMPIGVYFFSQATSLNEVYEEIEFMLDILGDYKLDYPIVLDWEEANPTEGRVRNVTRRELTDMLRYFCDEMNVRGFNPMVYFNWTQASKMIYLNELEDYPFWLALYQDRMTFPFRVEMWQYTSEGRVPGISGDVDINVYIPPI